jgi:PEP-CTERM motif/Protein of unknown function (DUF642)
MAKHIYSAIVAASAAVAGFCTVAGFQPASATEFIVNGSFEADPFTGSGLGYKLGLVGNDVTGWFIPSSDGTYPWGLQNTNAFGAGPTPYGNQWLVLGETGASGGTPNDYTIQQTMTGLTPGKTYSLSFAISSEEGCCSVVETSFLSGSSTGAQDFTAPAVTNYWNVWATESESFVATSSSVTLQFKDLAVEATSPDAGADLGLDNVSVVGSTVPEPATWAMLILGFGGLGIAASRKTKSRTAHLAR